MPCIFLLDTNVISEMTKPHPNEAVINKIIETQKILKTFNKFPH